MNLNTFLSKLLGGNKASRDAKLIRPIVDQVLAAYPNIQKLTNDELRAKTKELQNTVQHAADDLKEKIETLKGKIEETPYRRPRCHLQSDRQIGERGAGTL